MTIQKHLFFLLLFLGLSYSSFSQKNETILANHQKGGHSLGGIIIPFIGQESEYSIINLRYGYMFSDRNEIGLDLLFNLSTGFSSNEYYAQSDFGITSIYYRRYLGKKRFGVFVEGGYKLHLERRNRIVLNETTDRYEYSDEKYINIYAHSLYGTVGLYYHGIAKGRLGIEMGIGAGPIYFPGSNTNGISLGGDIQLRLKYFFKNKNYK